MRSGRIGVGIALATMVGCGGGGGGGDGAQTPPPPPPPTSESAGGIWSGTVSEGGSVVNDISCLVTDAGELACILIDPSNGAFAGGVRGTVDVVNGDEISGSGTSYAAPGYTLNNGATVGNFTITSGTVSERDLITVTATSGGATDQISMAFDTIYDRDSSLATVAAAYTAFDVFGDPASFSIDSAGALFAQTQSGCVGNGQVSVIDSQFNGYDVEVTVSNCPGLDGTYNGLAVTTDSAATNDVFLFGVFNGSTAIFGAPIK